MSVQDYEQLTLFPGDSRASLSPLPGSDEARRMTVSSGRKWFGLSKNSNPLGLLEKMLLESSIWHSTKYYLIWKPKGTKQGHFLYQLMLSVPHIEDIERQLWHGTKKDVQMWPTPKATVRGDCPSERVRRSPDLAAAVKLYNTPTAQDAKNGTMPKSQAKRDSLVGDVMRGMFATPQSRDFRSGQSSRWEDRQHRSRNLNDQIAMYPTPKTGSLCGGKHAQEKIEKLLKEKKITEEECRSIQAGNGGQLNPMWVEWLMGFPIGWTELDASEMP